MELTFDELKKKVIYRSKEWADWKVEKETINALHVIHDEETRTTYEHCEKLTNSLQSAHQIDCMVYRFTIEHLIAGLDSYYHVIFSQNERVLALEIPTQHNENILNPYATLFTLDEKWYMDEEFSDSTLESFQQTTCMLIRELPEFRLYHLTGLTKE